MIRIFLVAFAVVVAGNAGVHAHDKPDISPSNALAITPLSAQEQSIVAVINAFHTAIRSADSVKARELLTADARVDENGHAESVEQYLAHHFLQDAAQAKALVQTVSSISITASTDLAWVRREATTDGEFKGRTIRTTNIGTYLLRWQSGAWRIASVHWSARKRT